jgi:hypothetical protein
MSPDRCNCGYEFVSPAVALGLPCRSTKLTSLTSLELSKDCKWLHQSKLCVTRKKIVDKNLYFEINKKDIFKFCNKRSLPISNMLTYVTIRNAIIDINQTIIYLRLNIFFSEQVFQKIILFDGLRGDWNYGS